MLSLEERAKDVGLRIYKPSISKFFLKMLIYGDPGVGKTTLTATAGNVESMAPVLVISVEGGTLSLIEAKEVNLKHTPDVIDIKAWPELEEVFWFLVNDEHEYKTVVIDSLSELYKMNLNYIVARDLNKNTKRQGPDDIWLEDYGKSTKQMTRVIRAIRDLDLHVLMTCHASSQQDRDRNEKVFPSLPPKLREGVIGMMDVVGYMYTQEIDEEDRAKYPEDKRLLRKLLTQPYGKFIAKDRSPGGRLGLVVEEPDMPLLYSKIAAAVETK